MLIKGGGTLVCVPEDVVCAEELVLLPVERLGVRHELHL